jgi:hypothetical protein
LTLDHPTRIQIGTKKVVKITKNNEIPSKPRVKLILEEGIH